MNRKTVQTSFKQAFGSFARASMNQCLTGDFFVGYLSDGAKCQKLLTIVGQSIFLLPVKLLHHHIN